ncbi:RimJ/RimL family protein N-acetyltransferase, partial [Staphylococcus cohnii]
MFKTYINKQLSLKILEESDTQALFNVVDESRTYLAEWLPFVNLTKSSDDTK